MPIKEGKDSKGCFYQWGDQKKYYFRCDNKAARERAKAKAKKQEAAIYSSGYKGKE